MIFLLTLLLCTTVFSLSSFDNCCDLGRRNALNSRLCLDHSTLNSNQPVCKFAFTICCNQVNQNQECERGKLLAFEQDTCFDEKGERECDILTDCCNCCQIGILSFKETKTCELKLGKLNSDCNKVQFECCQKEKNRQYEIELHEDTCKNGFELDLDGVCVDIDECKRHKAICSQGSICENLEGSFRCSKTCGIGYQLDLSTTQCKDIDECSNLSHECKRGMRCENVPGSYRCIRETPCGTGYVVDSFTQNCIDVDECAINSHDCTIGYVCINLAGSFKCEPQECLSGYKFNYNKGECEAILCKKGYILDQTGRKCVDIDECSSLSNACKPYEKCENTQGSFQCILSLNCDQGFELNKEKTDCVDVDECASGKHNCPRNSVCRNNEGSYTCICSKGFDFNIQLNLCEDINECVHEKYHQCPANSICVNVNGSYDCRCDVGYKAVKQQKRVAACVDIDECLVPFMCHQKCINHPGSYECACHEGFYLGNDRRICLDVNECLSNSNICNGGECKNTQGGYECVIKCPQGFELDQIMQRCSDINECLKGSHNCTGQEKCVNIKGGFKCASIECPSGYTQLANTTPPRCERTQMACNELDCLQRPTKIFFFFLFYTTHLTVPMKIFTSPTLHVNEQASINYQYELRLTSKSSDPRVSCLTDRDFYMRHSGSRMNSVEIILLRQPFGNQELELELNMKVYMHGQYLTSMLCKINVFITD